MAINEDTGFPTLTPSEERMPSGSRLFRRAEELTDDQFDLLAAAWAEGALSGDALAELESVIIADDLRRVRAASFRNIRLTRMNEAWPGLRAAIRPSPVLTAFRRNVIPALLAVAAMIVIIISGPAGAKLKMTNPGNLTAEKGMTVAEIHASSPIIAVPEPFVSGEGTASVSAVPVKMEARATVSTRKIAMTGAPDMNSAFAENMTGPAESQLIVRVEPLAIAWSNAEVSAVTPTVNPGMAPVSMRNISPAPTMPEETNWMLRSVSFLASAVTGKEKQIDGYTIASGCITGINTIFGWDMELEQVNNKGGDPVAVSFSSSLLSFTKPVNKTSP